MKGDHEAEAKRSCAPGTYGPLSEAEAPLPALDNAMKRDRAGQVEVAAETAQLAIIDGERVGHTTRAGKRCRRAVPWARPTGIPDRPAWCIGLSAAPASKEFRALTPRRGEPLRRAMHG